MSLRERFDAKWIPVTESGCWIWAADNAGKYAQFRMSTDPKEGSESAHRAAWMIYRGPIPKGMMVCHQCDVPICVNPDHLFLGTATDNMRDAAKKGRMNWKPGETRKMKVGSAHHSSKVSETDVIAIRESNEKGVVLARRYGITPTVVSKIRRRLLWRHV
jgi:hypothetical protein